MSDKADIRAEATRLQRLFEAKGAEIFEADVLQPAGALLDLYGEEIRARAFVTQDPLLGEMMLRPDFTVPLVQQHMKAGRNEARYTYTGEVFRRQEDDPNRQAEYLQVGFEVFNGSARTKADAEVFATIASILAPLGLRAAIGDIGLLRSAVEGLDTSDARKSALAHHLWRPRRFRSMLNAFGPEPRRKTPVKQSQRGVEIGLRTRGEVEARLQAMKEERDAKPLDQSVITAIDALLAVREKAPDALTQLVEIAVMLPAIKPAIDNLAARFEALADLGVDIDQLDFEGSYGRTSLEYYDGFVFGFYADSRPQLPPVATGGRYDALTRAIGGTDVPAIGGVIRPGLTLDLGRTP